MSPNNSQPKRIPALASTMPGQDKARDTGPATGLGDFERQAQTRHSATPIKLGD